MRRKRDACIYCGRRMRDLPPAGAPWSENDYCASRHGHVFLPDAPRALVRYVKGQTCGNT